MISAGKLYTFFKRNFVLVKSTNGWYNFSNPFQPDGDVQKKMAVNFSYGWVKSWRKDNYSASIVTFLMDYTSMDYRGIIHKVSRLRPSKIDLERFDSLGNKEIRSIRMPKGYSSFIMNDGALAKRAKNYLAKRNFDVEYLDSLGIGYCGVRPDKEDEEDYFGYILIPFKVKGRLLYYIGRDFIGNFLRYKNPPKNDLNVGKGDLFYNEDALSIHKNIFILEGVLDAITMGDRAIAMCGNTLTKTQSLKISSSNAKRLIFIPDRGCYKEWVLMASKYMDDFDVRVINCDNVEGGLGKYGKDANIIGKNRILRQLRKTPRLTMSLFVKIAA